MVKMREWRFRKMLGERKEEREYVRRRNNESAKEKKQQLLEQCNEMSGRQKGIEMVRYRT